MSKYQKIKSALIACSLHFVSCIFVNYSYSVGLNRIKGNREIFCASYLFYIPLNICIWRLLIFLYLNCQRLVPFKKYCLPVWRLRSCTKKENAFSNNEAMGLLESILSFHFLMIKPQVVFNREIFPRDWSTNTFEEVSLALHALAWEQRACPYLSFLCKAVEADF